MTSTKKPKPKLPKKRVARASPKPKLVPAAKLLATPKPMLAWLRSKKPGAIATSSIVDNNNCLIANFLKASGHRQPTVSVEWFQLAPDAVIIPVPAWFQRVFYELTWPGHVTASQAIDTIVRVCRERKLHLRSLS